MKCFVVSLLLFGCGGALSQGSAQVPPRAPLTVELPRLKTTYELYTDTGAGEEVKAYYTGNPQWGPTTSEVSTIKEPVKMVTGYAWVDGEKTRGWYRTSTNVVLVSMRKYESECLMRRFVASQAVFRDPSSAPDVWQEASSAFLVSKAGANRDDAVKISCADFDKSPNDPSITFEGEADPTKLLLGPR